MAILYPKITEKNNEITTGRDFLGQQGIIQHMTNICIPTFTNSTSRFKYYSLWAWIISILEKNINKLKNKKIRYYILMLESAFIIINKYRYPEITGMPGSDSFIKILEEINNTKIKKIKIYYEKDRANAFTSVQYKPSLENLNILKKSNNTFYLDSNFGKKLAEEFDKTIKNCLGYENLISVYAGKKEPPLLDFWSHPYWKIRTTLAGF